MKLCQGSWSSNYKTGVFPLKQSTRTKIKTKKFTSPSLMCRS